MKIETTFLRSKVARRVFAQFVLAALIPVTVTALILRDQARDNLEQQSQTQLRAASRALGYSIFERLMFVDRVTEEMVTRLQGGWTIIDETRQFDTELFRDVAILTDPEEAESTFGTPIQLPNTETAAEHLAAGRALLATSASSGAQARLFIGRLVNSAEPGHGMLFAELKVSYLWGDPEAMPVSVDYCIFNSQGLVPYCSTDVAQAIAGQISTADLQSAQGLFAARHGGNAYFASSRDIFLARQYLSQNWKVVTIRSRADVSAPIIAFDAVYVPVILLSLLLVSFLSVTQIRKIMVPLDRLIRGTRRISKRQFQNVIDVASGDEFEELAASMNRMAQNLGSQFDTMQTLSKVDRLILSRADIETVIATVLASLWKTCKNDVASVTIIDNDSDAAARIFTDNSGQGDISIERVALGESEQRRLADGKGRVIDAEDANDNFLRPLVALGVRSLFALPIVLNGQLAAIVSLGFRDESVPSKRQLSRVKDFADRIAVALRVAERDQQLYRQAHYDLLTALPNRQLFKDRLQQSIAHAHRENHQGALLFIDLDRFKIVNDSQGHTVGDELLKQAALRLQFHARESDTVARLGGDEFTVILSNISSPRDASRVAEEIIELMGRPFNINDNKQFVSASIGVTIFPDDGATVEDLLKNADTAMYKAKAGGRGRHTFFTDQMNVEAINRHQVESDLHSALRRDQFFLEYQPQVTLGSNRIVGAEALIRWQHPERGLISPVDFIQVAEDTGHINSIGRWVLRTACEEYQYWQSQGVAPERVAVNISPAQIMQADFVSMIREVLTDTAMQPSCLELEITENLLLDNAEETLEKLKSLHAMGIRIAIDDFGTGYSSMTYLHQLSFDILKIDRSFIAGLGTSEESAAVVNAITAVAKSLRKEVIAEGIETFEQSTFLGRTHCQCGQGKLFAMPMPASQFASFTRAWKTKKAS